ncbi:MAG: hypothetical protein ACUVTZ_12780 [Armatimonadota bacterium]
MHPDVTAIIIVTIIFGSIFGPRLLREIANVLSRGSPGGAQANPELETAVQDLRRDVEQMRVVYTDKMLSLEKRMRELEQSKPVPSGDQEMRRRTLTERPTEAEQTQVPGQLPQTGTEG